MQYGSWPPVKQQSNNNVTHGFANFCDIWVYIDFVDVDMEKDGEDQLDSKSQ